MDVDVNSLRAAAAFADAVAEGLEHLEKNTAIETTVNVRSFAPSSEGPIDGMCEDLFVGSQAEIETLNQLFLVQRRLAALLHSLVDRNPAR